MASLLTALALHSYQEELEKTWWLMLFIPLVVSSGGNTGNQSATLVITALALGEVTVLDWWRVVRREMWTGLILGAFLGLLGFLAALYFVGPLQALVLPTTLLLVVVCGTLTGGTLPIVFQRLGWDPALMSNPFVAVIIDILGILIYMNVAAFLL